MIVNINEVRNFWDQNPLCASIIPFAIGTKQYFEYYDKLRESIEDVNYSYSLHEYQAFKDKKVLDVGCGNGYVLSRYAKEGAQIYGVDITPTAIDLCKKRFTYLDLKGDFREANAENLPFEDNYFDCICSMGVLHHVPSTENAVSEIFRVLKPGGRLIVMFYHRNSALYRLRFSIETLLTGKSKQQLVNEFDGIGNPKGWVYSKEELRKLLSSFTNLKLFVGYLIGTMISPRGGRFIPNAFVKPFERQFGWNLYAKGNKPN